MKQTHAVLVLAALAVFVLSCALPFGALAQSSGYSVDQVDHQVSVLQTGQIQVIDTIHVSGQIQDGFQIGLPSKYSADVVDALAFDSNNVFVVNLGVQLGDQAGFYAASIDFRGQHPSVFTVAFVLSNHVLTDLGRGAFVLDFPAYPSLAQGVGQVNAALNIPSSPSNLTIIKPDGALAYGTSTWSRAALPPYTFSASTANFTTNNGAVQLVTVTKLSRQINIDPSGLVTCADTYTLVNNQPRALANFTVDVPTEASSLLVKDDSGRTLTIATSSTQNGAIIATALLSEVVFGNQSTQVRAEYNLPHAQISGSSYQMANFTLFPNFQFYVNQVIVTLTPPEGASTTSPNAASLDPQTSLTRENFQDTLTITRNGVSNLDYAAPEQNKLAFAYDYSPVWVSFRPTFWAALLAVVGCVALVVVRRRKPAAESAYEAKRERQKPKVAATPQALGEQPQITGQHVTADLVKDFVEAFEDKKALSAEIRSLDQRAQKGKLPRRQYKVQRRQIEVRLEGIGAHIENTKAIFRGTGGFYADIAKQLDTAEADLTAAEENLRSLESQQSRGEVTLEYYKKNIGDDMKARDKAESAISGILLRLREKIR